MNEYQNNRLNSTSYIFHSRSNLQSNMIRWIRKVSEASAFQQKTATHFHRNFYIQYFFYWIFYALFSSVVRTFHECCLDPAQLHTFDLNLTCGIISSSFCYLEVETRLMLHSLFTYLNCFLYNNLDSLRKGTTPSYQKYVYLIINAYL